MPQRPEIAKGLGYGISAYLIWGSFPLVILALAFADPFEIVVWRVIFGLAFALLLLLITRGFRDYFAVLSKPKQLGWLAIAAVTIFINWQVYVFAVVNGQVLEASLGYFINPLITVAIAVLFLGEKLNRSQLIAMAIGLIAVIVLGLGYGRPPWIALTLASTFGLYGLAKNRMGAKVGALPSFAIETTLLLPVAIIQLVIIANLTQVQFGWAGIWQSLGLAGYGALTAIPLILFGASAKRVPLSYLGFMQFLTPILQFLIGLFVLGEEMTPLRWFGFFMVWSASTILTVDAYRTARMKRAVTEPPAI